jgi:multicomponent Na+:H+ antiporter subunit F
VTAAQFASWVVLPLLALALLLVLVRLLRGPTLPDRVVALDLLSILGLGICAALAVATGQALLLDVALVTALVGFLGTVAFASYVERRR